MNLNNFVICIVFESIQADYVFILRVSCLAYPVATWLSSPETMRIRSRKRIRAQIRKNTGKIRVFENLYREPIHSRYRSDTRFYGADTSRIRAEYVLSMYLHHILVL